VHGKVLMVNEDKCTGCMKCVVACVLAHTGSTDNPERAHIKVWKSETGEIYTPLTCHHCETASCVEACPTEACHREPENQRVIIDENACIGCESCVVACPFGHAHFDNIARVSTKCDYCDGEPECVRVCEPGAISYVYADENSLDKRRESGMARAQGQLIPVRHPARS